jgi:hypothetical protein
MSSKNRQLALRFPDVRSSLHRLPKKPGPSSGRNGLSWLEDFSRQGFSADIPRIESPAHRAMPLLRIHHTGQRIDT